jgi:holo-[acyl-carrier protein] synthase
MAILGIGVDIAEIDRFDGKKLSTRFLNSIFTLSERNYCLNKSKPSQHFAARFAAKEATVKAIGAAGMGFVSVAQVEVLRLEGGAPSIRLIHGRHDEAPPQLPHCCKLHVSLSHSSTQAIAMVILEQI